MNLQSYPAEEWVRDISRPYHLTIQDIISLSPGEKIEVLCLDRNWMDFTIYSGKIPENVSLRPEEFFKYGYQGIFTKGELQSNNFLNGSFYFEGIDSCPREDWTFDLNYREEDWFPLYQNHLPVTVCENPQRQNYCLEFCQGCSACCQPGPKKYSGVDLSEAISKNLFGWTWQTRIGWRGPMIQKDKLKYLPSLYYSKK